MPLGYLAMGFYPEYGFKVGDYQAPTRKQFFGEETVRFGKGLLVQQALTDPLHKVLTPFGGNQANRMIDGNKALTDGYFMHGDKRIYLDDSAKNRIIANTFGKYALPEVREYFDEKSEKSQERYMDKRGSGSRTF